MMETMESCIPPGFRFHPTDEELVGYYLKKKVASQKIDLDVIRDIDLYRIEPWDLQERCRVGYEEQNEWYFFSHKDKKYPTSTRTNRATMAGFWKATGRDKAVYDKSKLIGMRKTLVFYKGRAPNGQKSDWIMHEYRLESDENAPPQEEGWVVCRAFKKKTSQAKAIESSSSPSYYYDEPSGTIPTIDVAYYTRQAQNPFFNQNLICKQEIELAEHLNNNFMSSGQFLQLPQLESSSIPLMKGTMSSTPLMSRNNEDSDRQVRGSFGNTKVTDWRALDKFVASQLSHDHVDGIYESCQNESSNMGSLLLESARDEAGFFNDFPSSILECDIGICNFDE